MRERIEATERRWRLKGDRDWLHARFPRNLAIRPWRSIRRAPV